ncbi:helix-turn-helix domain-containing protein [Spartinivicinus poritis]|uniref:Helix-turn-helix transcriptional regulator n=1 Tax=Spartinivicinus poritis TaxID=2994640 RepID=A0ABT5U6A9_9GAMM|nr:helix-turn-helix transcriptional regulator [Spartinivicinus sp. A2-2]MDE1461888.1 helix-turn-helix transcriptional regulator [Spartinivicinus sp. A2-2]
MLISNKIANHIQQYMLCFNLAEEQQQSLASILSNDGENGYISLAQLDEALVFIYAITKDPDIHIKVANSITVSSLGVAGLLALNSMNVENSIHCLMKYCRNIIGSEAELKFDSDSPVCKLSFYFKTEYSLAIEFLSVYFLSFIDFILSSMTYQKINYTQLKLLKKEHYSNLNLLKRFGYICVLNDGELLWEIGFSSSHLNTKAVYYHQHLHKTLKSKLVEEIDIKQEQSLQELIYNAIFDMNYVAKINLSEVAKKIKMSPRTIQRKLSDEGVSFTDIQRKAIYQSGARFLNNPSYSIKEVAYCLGFTSVQAFHRAFKRASGMTPAQYRDKIR